MSNRPQINAEAAEIAAKSVGLRPDQVARAVSEYRAVAAQLHEEPEWRALSHMSGAALGISQYIDPVGETSVTLQIDSWTERGEWQSKHHFAYRGKLYESYGEARGIELSETTRAKPYAIDGLTPSLPDKE